MAESEQPVPLAADPPVLPEAVGSVGSALPLSPAQITGQSSEQSSDQSQSPRLRESGSTANGTVIMPRPEGLLHNSTPLPHRSSGSSITMEFGAEPAPGGSTAIRRQQEQSRGSSRLQRNDEAELVSQQTVISRQPWGSPPSLGSVTPREMGRILAGQTLGHYSLTDFVGGGGMGAVFRAHDTSLNRTVAVKVLAPNQSRDEDTLRRFQNEAQSAARLDHEHIGRVHYVGEDRGWHYIVFEFIEGENLRDYVDHEGPLSLPDTLKYLDQLGTALDHASGREVVHRDIKPSNVIITPEGRAKLVDMGLARLHQVEAPQEDLTASGVTLGTFDYISPEQARDPRIADVRSDLYSLGCTLYYMLTGQPPFPTGTVLQKLLQHQADEPADPRQWRPELPAELIAILSKMMAKQPAQRYQTAHALVVDVHLLNQKLGLPSQHLPRPPLTLPVAKKTTAWQRQLPWLVPLGICLLGLTLWQIFDQPAQRPARPSWVQPVKSPTPDTTVALNQKNSNLRSLPAAEKSAAQLALEPRVRKTGELFNTPGAWSLDAGPVPVLMDSGLSYSRQLADSYVHNWQQTIWPQLTHALPLLDRIPLERLALKQSPLSAEAQASADSQASTARASSPASAANATRAHGRLAVLRDPKAPGEYETLQAALREARPGDTIELRYTGIMQERPLTLNNPQLKIVAAEGFRPIIRLQPRDTGALTTNRGLVTITGGKLLLERVHFDLEIPETPTSDVASLFDLRQVEELSLAGCSVTIRSQGATPGTLALFEVRAGLSSSIMRMKEPRMAIEPTRIIVERSILRGDLSLMRAVEHEPLRFALSDSLVAVADYAFSVDFGIREHRHSLEPPVQIQLTNSTLLLGSGLCRLSNGERAMNREPTAITLNNVVLRGSENAPLCELDGGDKIDDLREVLRWQTDTVRIDQFTTLARLVGMGGTTNLGIAQWNEVWRDQQRQTAIEPLVWSIARERLPAMARLQPVDLSWTAAETATPIELPETTGILGIDASLLPPLP
jgi:serine/threonine protein kinase